MTKQWRERNRAVRNLIVDRAKRQQVTVREMLQAFPDVDEQVVKNALFSGALDGDLAWISRGVYGPRARGKLGSEVEGLPVTCGGTGGPSPLPVEYAGVTFRSTLEAGWAQTLDAYGVRWSYEPQAFVLPSGKNYLPDFWLEDSQLWAEVKGPGVPGLDKVDEFGESFNIIVLEPPIRGYARWSWRDSVASRRIGSGLETRWVYSKGRFVTIDDVHPSADWAHGWGSDTQPPGLPWAGAQWKPKR